ncbi:hypothetical protein [Reichenbachiella agariperforans]|uniref:hypothetical protein n=1 Tax=Reichenbachiella agariperforans TaxID=156994 RepID=UPI001C0820A7|nr:hypothetical protein [Reichenbachiella agariperforans]MBU2912588.1 hypothetical protein [Reichenbachiella agariperforans]
MKKLIAMVMICGITAVLPNVAQAQEDPQVVSMIEVDLKKRLNTQVIHQIEYQDWGVYWVKANSIYEFDEPVYHISAYTKEGVWMEDKFDISHRIPVSIQAAIDKREGAVLAFGQLIYTSENAPYYKMVLKSGETMLMDTGFEKMEVGPLRGGLVLTSEVKKDIEERLENAYIIGGYQDFNQQYTVIFKTDYVEFQNGQILYSKQGEWVETKAFLHDYFKLPLELMMYVNDHGGLDNFGPVNQVWNATESYYFIKFKDGSSVKLDLELNEL